MDFIRQTVNEAPQKGVVPSTTEIFSQTERFWAEFDNTLSVDYLRSMSLDGFPEAKAPLPGQSLKKLDGSIGQDSEHEMTHDFSCTPDANKESSEIILESAVDSLGGGALFETLCGGRIHGDFLAAPRIKVNDRNMSEAFGKLSDLVGIVGSIHQIVETIDPFVRDLSQRDGDLRIVEGSGGEYGADGQVSIHDIEVKFVTDPSFGEALGVALATVITAHGQISQIFSQGALRLELQTGGRFGWKRLIFGWAPPFLGRLNHRGWFWSRLFARRDCGRITADMSDDFTFQIFLNHGGMNFFRQTEECEVGKGAGEGGFGGDLRSGFPTAESAQGGTIFQIVQQGAGGGEIPDCFGDEGLCQRQAILRFATDEYPLKRGHEAFGVTEFHDLDQALFLVGERADFFFEHGKELALDEEGGGGEVHKKLQNIVDNR